ncbi:MAG TPA: hypothetical protein VJR49_03015 [Chthoniobacterales bacterium]|nr:hypothetical protein [Chthoniobacterales bacterium]
MATDTENFRLAVLNPGGRDHEEHFTENRPPQANEHPPVNFHAYAACTRGAVFRDTKRAIASNWPVLLLLRGDFRTSEKALVELKKSKRKTVVALKETGAHQIAQQLSDPARFARFVKIVGEADGCIASTPEAADLFRSFRLEGVDFIPTPYPIEDENWNWAMEHRSGIFVGTRELSVPTRHHFAALLAAKKLSEETKEPVTVFNSDRRRGARLIAEIGFRKIRIHEKRMGYRAYLGEVARHKIVFQLDRSRVPGQVAGDALLCRSVCVGGDGAIERIAFPETCGEKRSDDDLAEIAQRLLTNEDQRLGVAQGATKIAKEKLSFRGGKEHLARFLADL